MSVTATTFRKLALSLPETTEGSHMGHPDFRVRDKIFAMLTADETRCAVKCDATSLESLVRTDPDTYRDAWGGRWLGADLGRTDEDTIAALLEDAWCRTAPKRLVAERKRLFEES